jgi:hypothetical protein
LNLLILALEFINSGAWYWNDAYIRCDYDGYDDGLLVD